MRFRLAKPGGAASGRPSRSATPPPQFERMQAASLYCPRCREATPVREVLLLVLPDGNLYDYRCARCGTSTGSRTEKESAGPAGIPR